MPAAPRLHPEPVPRGRIQRHLRRDQLARLSELHFDHRDLQLGRSVERFVLLARQEELHHRSPVLKTTPVVPGIVDTVNVRISPVAVST